MKTIKLIIITIFLLLNSVIKAQKISPYIPIGYVNTSQINPYQTQFTYLDFNYVNVNIQKYLSSNFDMFIKDTKYNINKNGEGIITVIFSEKSASNRKLKNIITKYYVFAIEHDLVIKKVIISGSSNLVLNFYIKYWTTNLNFDDIKKKEIVSNRLLQDRISFSYNKGKAYITIENSNFKNKDEFLDFFNKKLATIKIKKIENRKKDSINNIKRIKQIEKKKKEEKERRKKEEEKQRIEKKRKANTINKTFAYKVIVRKKKIIIRNKNKRFKDIYADKSNMKEELKEFIKDKKKGSYSIYVKYKIIYDKVENIDFKIMLYEKPNSALRNFINY